PTPISRPWSSAPINSCVAQSLSSCLYFRFLRPGLRVCGLGVEGLFLCRRPATGPHFWPRLGCRRGRPDYLRTLLFEEVEGRELPVNRRRYVGDSSTTI